MVAKQGRRCEQPSETIIFCTLSAWVWSREPEFLWPAPGVSVCQFLLPADKLWLPISSTASSACGAAKLPAAKDCMFSQQATGVNEHTWTNLTLGGGQRACTTNPPLGSLTLKSKGRLPWISVLVPLPSRPIVPRSADIWFTVLMLDGGAVTGLSDTLCQDTLSTVASVLFTRPAAFSSMADHFSMQDESVCGCLHWTYRVGSVLRLNARHKERGCGGEGGVDGGLCGPISDGVTI